MNDTEQKNNSLYTPQLIQFTAIGVKFATLLEREDDKNKIIKQLVSVLPRLYHTMLILPNYFYSQEDYFLEEHVNEITYENIKTRIQGILGEDDLYLSAVSNEMQYSDTPIALHISEGLADIYQHVGNLLGIIKEQNEIALPAAIGRCRLYWQEHWGLALISVLSPLHSLYNESTETDIFDYESDENEYE